MQGKKTVNLEQSQSGKKIKSIKVLYSNSHNDRPKISMEGKWLEQLGFHIGDKLQVSYGDKFIFIKHAVDKEQLLAVAEPGSAYMAEMEASRDMGQVRARQKLENAKSKLIKVASSIHMRQTAWRGGPLYYPERSKISMEGKWLDSAGFHTGDRVQVEYQENAICIYPAV